MRSSSNCCQYNARDSATSKGWLWIAFHLRRCRPHHHDPTTAFPDLDRDEGREPDFVAVAPFALHRPACGLDLGLVLHVSSASSSCNSAPMGSGTRLAVNSPPPPPQPPPPPPAATRRNTAFAISPRGCVSTHHPRLVEIGANFPHPLHDHLRDMRRFQRTTICSMTGTSIGSAGKEPCLLAHAPIRRCKTGV